MKKNTKKAPTITRFDANDDRMFVSDSTVMCGECFASAPYRVTPEAPGFSCHCMKYLKTSGFYFDDNHFGGDDSTMLLFRESPEDPSKTEFFGRDGNFAGTKDVGVSEFSETSKVLEKEWFSAHAAEIAAEFAQTDERNRRSNRENGWEKEASRLFEAAMRGYHPKHRYLFVGDLELDASVVRAAELIKEATGAKLVFMGDVIDRGARYPWNTDGKYVTETLMRISDHFVIGTHEAVFMFRAMEEIRNEGEVSEATFNLYFNPRSRVAVSNGGPVTARELLGVGTLPTGAEAAEGLYFAPMRERVSHALRKPGNAFMEFWDWVRKNGKLSVRLETLDGERILAVHGGVPAEKDGSLSEAFRGLSGNALFAALEGGLAGNDTEAFNALVYDTMGSHDGSSKKNPVWFLGREYVDMGRKAFDAFLRNAETDVVVVGHDNQVPASFYDGKLRGLDACGRIRKESAMLTGKPGEKSDIFLFL